MTYDDRPEHRRAVRGLAAGPHRLPVRRRRHAPAAGRGLDAQPGADGRRRFLVKDLHSGGRTAPGTSCATCATATSPPTTTAGSGWPAPAPTPSPYFRVFNPVTQGRRFDPDGDYVRRYVPELAHLAGAAAHEPWKAPGRLRPRLPRAGRRPRPRARGRPRALRRREGLTRGAPWAGSRTLRARPALRCRGERVLPGPRPLLRAAGLRQRRLDQRAPGPAGRPRRHRDRPAAHAAAAGRRDGRRARRRRHGGDLGRQHPGRLGHLGRAAG